MWDSIKRWIKILLPITTGLLTVAAVVVITVMFSRKCLSSECSDQNALKYIIALVGSIGFGMGIYYFWEEGNRKRRSAAMTEITAMIEKARRIGATLRKEGANLGDHFENRKQLEKETIEKWAALDNLGAKKLEHYLTSFVNQADAICAGVRFYIYDEYVSYNLVGIWVMRVWEVLGEKDSKTGWIHQMRTRDHWPQFADHLEWLALHWQAKYKKVNKRFT